MNILIYFKQVVLLALLLPFFSISLKSQCGQPDGTIIVNSLNDEGAGTLRDAINCANIRQGTSRIIFDISTNDRAVIQVGSTSGQPLPDLIRDGIIIDGTTQPGFGNGGNFEPKIVLDGANTNWDLPINAMSIYGDGIEIYGLEIRNFPDDGIDVIGADNVIIGDEEKGNIIFNCGAEQDIFPATGTNNRYNGVGIVVDNNAENIEILNNIIGTDYNNSPNLGNEWAGIYMRDGADFGLIEGNIIAGNVIGIGLNNVFAVKISENEISCNTESGIDLINGANDDKVTPVVTSATNNSIRGSGTPGDEVEVFISTNCGAVPCQGGRFLGRAIVQSDRTWVLNAPYTINISGGESITTLAIDNNDRTSSFSACQVATFENSSCADANGIISVTNANDEGAGSLREAILCANSTPGPNTIQFNIPGNGRQQINVGSTSGDPLPFIRDAYTILDGTTQPGFGTGGNYEPQIVLDGGSIEWRFPHNAIWLRADYCEIYGLEVRNFPDDGIDITGGDFNIIGAPNKGNVIYNCGDEKDIFEDDPNQREYNGCGIVMKNGAQNTTIQGNIIGTDYSQTVTIGNELCGIIMERTGNSNNIIGGTNPSEGNVIAYNELGITVFSGSNNNQFLGNSFYCNSNNGIELSGNANNSITSPVINVASTAVVNGIGQNGSSIEIYTISDNCQEGPCQGNILIGRTTVINGTWRLDAPFLNGIVLQGGQQITALATDANGNTSKFSDCVTLGGVAPPPNCDLSLGISNFNNETCAGNDGTFTISVENAVAPISYDFGNGASSSPIFSNLSAGTYSVTATDDEDCSATLTVTISKDPTPSLSIVSTNNENCGAADGGFTIVAEGGQSPYIYELSTGEISRTPDFDNLAAGNYSVSVIDANNCIATQSINIQQTGSINVAVADMRADNCNSAAGSFRLSPTGGQAPYTYDLGNGAISSNEFTGLSAGNYAVTVADFNNCSTVAIVNITGGTPPVSEISNLTQTSCTQPTGSVSLTINGGQSPFQYDIGNGRENSPTFSNLSAGDYEVTITDANQCTTTQSFTINEPAQPTLSIVSTANASCGNANGIVTVTQTGGQGPYTYDIGFGISTSPSFNGLAAGDYTVKVVDDNGCSDEMAITIENSPTPTLVLENMQDASCNLPNAIITVAGTGAEPLTYDIGNGPTNSPTFSNLLPGNYTVTLTDNNNCTASTTIEIKSSGGPTVNVQSTSEARCDKANGSFTISAFGGFAPYTYDIGDGPTDSPEFVNLAGGNYEVTLTDANGCEATQLVTLGNIPAPTFGIGDIVDATCGEANGSFKVSAFSGTPPYQFNIGGANTPDPVFTGLQAGSYTVVVSDANNCITPLRVFVEGTEAPTIEVKNELPANCGQADGSFDLEVSGGIAPYFFDIGDGESTNNLFRNLSPGDYEVTITDASSCSQIRTIEVKGTAEISIAVNDRLPAVCGQANGAFSLEPSGGTGPYTYELGGQSYTDPSFTNLNAGVYEVKTIDADGCFTVQSIEVADTDGPAIEVDIIANCGDEDAEVKVNASQGTAPYTYDIGEGFSDSDLFRKVAPGLHQITVKDANGCESFKNITITISNQVPEASIDITKQPGCSINDGSIKINVTKGIPPYLYAMSETEKSPFSTFSNLGSGTYQITVTDAGGCETLVPVTLDGGTNNPIAAFDLSFNELNASFTNMTENGTTYNWDFGDGNSADSENANHEYLSAGSYTICLTATNDCGSDEYCENYTIEALNTNKSFEFDFGEVRGAVGEKVKIPVFVKNFRETVGFQKSVHLGDPSVAKITAITDVTLKDLSPSLFSIKDDQITVSWFDGAIEGFDLPDSTIIYQIEVEILADDACTDVLIKQEPLPTQVYKKVGSNEVEVEFFQRNGSVCSGEGGNSNQTANISGLITLEDESPISDVTLTCTNTTDIKNDEDGKYAFTNLATPNKYVVTPTKTADPLNGITTFDLLNIQNHILGNEKLDSPYKIIAADANNTKSVTVADILMLRKLILQDITTLPSINAWRFIPADFEFTNPENPFQDDFPESASIDLNDKNLTADFIGLKVGDVNNTASPNGLVIGEARNQSNETVTLITKNVYLKKGQVTTINFAWIDKFDLSGFQFTLAFDPNEISIESIQETSNLNANNFGKKLLDRGYLLTSWLEDPSSKQSTTAKLFTLTVRAKKSGSLSELLKLSNNYLAPEAYNKAGKKVKLGLSFIEDDLFINGSFQLNQNAPNPFSKSTEINYHLPDKSLVNFSLFDIHGRLLKSMPTEGQKGWNQLTIEANYLPKGGLYYYQINTAFGQATKKMLLVK